ATAQNVPALVRVRDLDAVGETGDHVFRLAVSDRQIRAGLCQGQELSRIQAALVGEDEEPLSAELIFQEKSAFLGKDDMTGQLARQYGHANAKARFGEIVPSLCGVISSGSRLRRPVIFLPASLMAAPSRIDSDPFTSTAP